MKRIGFAGIGTMGRFMAHNIMRAGFELHVYNRTAEKAEPLVDEGATLCESPKALGEQCELVVICVSDAPDVREVILGEHGVARGMKSNGIIVDCSTSAPQLAREMDAELRQRGIGILDAPVSGGPEGARHGALSIMCGGEEDVFARAKPVLEAMGKTITLVGPASAGQLAKAVNQIVVATALQAVSEGVALARKSGIDPEKVLSAISGGAAASWILDKRGPLITQEKFTPANFRIELHAKDLRIALDAAKECQADLKVASMVKDIFQDLVDHGHGALDHSGVYKYTKEKNGL